MLHLCFSHTVLLNLHCILNVLTQQWHKGLKKGISEPKKQTWQEKYSPALSRNHSKSSNLMSKSLKKIFFKSGKQNLYSQLCKFATGSQSRVVICRFSKHVRMLSEAISWCLITTGMKHMLRCAQASFSLLSQEGKHPLQSYTKKKLQDIGLWGWRFLNQHKMHYKLTLTFPKYVFGNYVSTSAIQVLVQESQIVK